jgi:hypothetical protein
MGMLRYYIEDHKQGAFELGAPTTDVLTVTGRPAEDFETTVRRYASLPGAQPTLSNRMRELAKFMSTPFAPGYNPACDERDLGLPTKPNSRYAMADEHWRDEHAGTARLSAPLGI